MQGAAIAMQCLLRNILLVIVLSDRLAGCRIGNGVSLATGKALSRGQKSAVCTTLGTGYSWKLKSTERGVGVTLYQRDTPAVNNSGRVGNR